MSQDTLKFNLDARTTKAVQEIAQQLGIQEIEVIRNGLTFMSLYTRLKTKNQGRILIEENDNLQELII